MRFCDSIFNNSGHVYRMNRENGEYNVLSQEIPTSRNYAGCRLHCDFVLFSFHLYFSYVFDEFKGTGHDKLIGEKK